MTRKQLAPVAASVGGVALLMGVTTTRPQSSGQELVARKLTIVDESGRPRIELRDGRNQLVSFVSQDGPRFGLYDKDGKPRLALNVSKQGPAIHLSDGNASATWTAHSEWRTGSAPASCPE